MPTYKYWLISLALHAMALSVVVPDSWFAVPADSPSLPSLKLVPPQRTVYVPPPAGRPPQLGHVVRSSTPKPAVPRARVDHPPPPRVIRVSSTATQWTQLLPMVASAEVPKPKAKPAAMVKRESSPPTAVKDIAPIGQKPVPNGPAMALTGGHVASAEEGAASASVGVKGNGAGDDLGGNNASDGPTGGGDGPLGMPSYNQTPLPAYPRLAKLRGWEGVTVLRVEVREDGSVGQVEMARSSGHGALDDAALKAVRAWRFEPARRGDMAVRCVIEVPIRFKLDNVGA